MNATTGSSGKKGAATALRKVFVIVDPTRLVQPALERAEWVAAINGAALHAYCCVYDSQLAFDHEAKHAAVTRTRDWLGRVTDRLDTRALGVTIEVDWDSDWLHRNSMAAERSGADLLFKTSVKHTKLARHLMQAWDWVSLHSSSRPMVLVRPYPGENPRIVLAAVKLRRSSTGSYMINDRVVSGAHWIASALGAELHAVTACHGEGVPVDRERLAELCRLTLDRVHVRQGLLPSGISRVAAEIDAGMLVVGAMSRNPRHESGFFHNASRLAIDEIDADIAVIPRATQRRAIA